MFYMKVSRQIFGILLRGILVAMILGMTGGHWAILQTVAWTKMIIVYSRSSSIQTALVQTFDGQHPCKMCKLIQKAKQSSKQQELQQPSVKRDTTFFEAHVSNDLNPPHSWLVPAEDFTYPSRSDPPPVPPPRNLPTCS